MKHNNLAYRANNRVLPPVGTVISRKFKGKIYRMKIVKHGNDIGFEVNGKIYNSPSAAARPIFKNEINGWRFWKIMKK